MSPPRDTHKAAGVSPASRYTLGAIALHWIIASLIFANLFLGWRMGFLKGLAQFDMVQLHKSIGISVLLLSVARLGWRLANQSPPLPADMNTAERLAAHAVHGALYGVMIVMPLTGWAMVSASPYNIPTMLWHAIPWPHLWIHDLPTTDRKAIESAIGRAHLTLAFGSLALVALHLCAALKHQFVSRDGLLGRMIPGLELRSNETST
jgi:cytochrome b561